MPRPYSAKLVLKVLGSKGFFFVSQIGSHVKYRKIGNPTLTPLSSRFMKKKLDTALLGLFCAKPS